MNTIKIRYNKDRQFDGVTLDNGELEHESALALYEAAAERMSVNHTVELEEFPDCHPNAPEVWEMEEIETITQPEQENLEREFQDILDDVMSQGDFWVTSEDS